MMSLEELENGEVFYTEFSRAYMKTNETYYGTNVCVSLNPESFGVFAYINPKFVRLVKRKPELTKKIQSIVSNDHNDSDSNDPDHVTITLTQEQALTLFVVCQFISGPPHRSRRGDMDSISEMLADTLEDTSGFHDKVSKVKSNEMSGTQRSIRFMDSASRMWDLAAVSFGDLKPGEIFRFRQTEDHKHIVINEIDSDGDWMAFNPERGIVALNPSETVYRDTTLRHYGL